MIHEYMKPLSKCSKDELRLLLQGQLPPSKTVLPTYKAPEPLNIQIGGR